MLGDQLPLAHLLGEKHGQVTSETLPLQIFEGAGLLPGLGVDEEPLHIESVGEISISMLILKTSLCGRLINNLVEL